MANNSIRVSDLDKVQERTLERRGILRAMQCNNILAQLHMAGHSICLSSRPMTL